MTLWCLKKGKKLIYESINRIRSEVQDFAMEEFTTWDFFAYEDPAPHWKDLKKQGFSIVKVKLEEVNP